MMIFAGGGMKTSTLEVKMADSMLEIKYKYKDEFGDVSKSSFKKTEIEDKELVHSLIQSAWTFLIAAGYNPQVDDQPMVIEWSTIRNMPSEYEIGNTMLITLKDPKAPVTTAKWNGEEFDGIKTEDILAWAYMIPRYDDVNIWY